MSIFKRKPIYLQTDNDKFTDSKDIPDKSINNFDAIVDIFTANIYTEESEYVRVLSNKGLYRALILIRNKTVDTIRKENNPHYGVTYGENLIFYLDELIHRLKDLEPISIANMYPRIPVMDMLFVPDFKKDPVIIVNKKSYTTVDDIAEITLKSNESTEYRGNSSGFRVQIPYLSTNKLLDKIKYNASQAVNYGISRNNIGYLLLETVRRIENNEMKVSDLYEYQLPNQ